MLPWLLKLVKFKEGLAGFCWGFALLLGLSFDSFMLVLHNIVQNSACILFSSSLDEYIEINRITRIYRASIPVGTGLS